MPLMLPGLALLMAVMVPSSRVPLKTSPKPPKPRRLALEKLLVAVVSSFMVKIFADLPPLLFAFNMSRALLRLCSVSPLILCLRRYNTNVVIMAVVSVAIANNVVPEISQ